MNAKRQRKSKLHLLAIIWGSIVTAFMLLVFGVKIIDTIINEGFSFLIEIPKDLVTWDDNPTGFFFTYLIGYAIVWWRPLWGSIIIILASIVYVLIAGIDGPPIFAAPGFLVGLLYLLNWVVSRRNQIKS